MKAKTAAALILAAASPAGAQSTISATDKYGYAANAGWIDFRPSAADGVVVTETYLAGKAYAANFGWIDLGDGSPTNHHTYSNSTATDHGVNMGPAGDLTGYAYAANIGWISFEQLQGKPALDFATGRFRGFAYSANLGWIALESSAQNFVLATSSLASPDSDQDGIADAWEWLHFEKLSTANAITDADGDGVSDLREYLANTDPRDPSSYFRITSQAYNEDITKVALSFTSVSNRSYVIEQSTALEAPWSDSGLGLIPPDPGATTTRSLVFPAGPKRFFRALAKLPLSP